MEGSVTICSCGSLPYFPLGFFSGAEITNGGVRSMEERHLGMAK